MRRLILGCAVAVALAAPAMAQGARAWLFDDNPEMVVLQYGSPDTDEIVIAFSCDPRAKRMRIVEAVNSDKLKPGGPATFKLSAGTTSLDLAGDAIANEMDGAVNIEVNGPLNPRVFALLKAGPSLLIEVLGGKETVPLAGATEHLPAFEKLCFGRR